jgi:hypothetical protein
LRRGKSRRHERGTPRYDWVGTFSDGRAAVRLGGLYGFVDEAGHEIVKPQYRIVGDYKFGFAQVDVDGKSGLIDRDGKMIMEPKYGLMEAVPVVSGCLKTGSLAAFRYSARLRQSVAVLGGVPADPAGRDLA